MKQSVRRGALVIVLVLLLGTHSSVAQVETESNKAGYSALSALTSLIYAPVKIAYAIGGGIIGGFAWLLSAGDHQVMYAVITPAVRGDYVVTPAHLRGERELEFIGRDPDY